jgi:uncharacterized phage-associated protein
MATPYSAITVTNWFIDRNQKDHFDLTHLKIHQLLYYAQGFYLVNFNKPLLEDNIEAWKYGPVIRSIYFSLKSNENTLQIVDKIKGFIIENGQYIITSPTIGDKDLQTIDFLSDFWQMYGKYNNGTLIKATQQKGTPWDQVNKALIEGATYNHIIPMELLKHFFSSHSGGE